VVADWKSGNFRECRDGWVWRDLPAGLTDVAGSTDGLRAGRLILFLGTHEGLFESLDGEFTGRDARMDCRQDLVDRWLRGDGILIASLRQGGRSTPPKDEGMNWNEGR